MCCVEEMLHQALACIEESPVLRAGGFAAFNCGTQGNWVTCCTWNRLEKQNLCLCGCFPLWIALVDFPQFEEHLSTTAHACLQHFLPQNGGRRQWAECWPKLAWKAMPSWQVSHQTRQCRIPWDPQSYWSIPSACFDTAPTCKAS